MSVEDNASPCEHCGEIRHWEDHECHHCGHCPCMYCGAGYAEEMIDTDLLCSDCAAESIATYAGDHGLTIDAARLALT